MFNTNCKAQTPLLSWAPTLILDLLNVMQVSSNSAVLKMKQLAIALLSMKPSDVECPVYVWHGTPILLLWTRVPIHVHVIQGWILSAIASRDPRVLKTPTPRLAREMVSGAIKFWEEGFSLVWLGRQVPISLQPRTQAPESLGTRLISLLLVYRY